ncbi:MAG TPA: hypothetical protein VJC39_03245 [Candidatus Nanoarchaeia archaeon]|nr:hypothetical protein [Candidatus Nanoarchaeia archaeon]
MRKLSLVVVIVVLLITSLIYAKEATPATFCQEDLDCVSIFGPGYTCSLQSFTCFEPEIVLPQPTEPTVATVTNATNLDLENKINILQTEDLNLKQELGAIKTKQKDFQDQLNQVSTNLQLISTQQQGLKTELNKGFDNVATGLAALQENLESIDVNVESVDKKRRSLTQFVVLIVASIIIAIIVLTYYRKKTQFHPDVKNYITHHIKKGNKYLAIESSLLQAGWPKDKIQEAYKETMKHNYAKYSENTAPAPADQTKSLIGTSPPELRSKTSNSTPNIDKNKVIFISIVSILVIIGAILVIRGTTVGQAYFSYGGVQDYVESTGQKTLLCFPPKIQSGTGCCLDINSNGKCDDAESFIDEGAGSACTKSADCPLGRSCVDQACYFVSELYATTGCNVKCNLIRAKITARNEKYPEMNPEEYVLPRKGGSYTGAGAVEWLILEGPDYCQIPTTEVVIPIKIILKHQGQVLSEEVVALKTGQKSKEITHPFVELYGFTLTVDEVFHTCGTSIQQ